MRTLQSKRIEGRFNGQMKYASVEGNDIKLSLPSIVSPSATAVFVQFVNGLILVVWGFAFGCIASFNLVIRLYNNYHVSIQPTPL